MQLDLFGDGEKRKLSGIARVILSGKQWHDAALGILHRDLPFNKKVRGEDFRRIVEPQIGPPHHPNAWGALANATIDFLQLLPQNDYQASSAPRNNAHKYDSYIRPAPPPAIPADHHPPHLRIDIFAQPAGPPSIEWSDIDD